MPFKKKKLYRISEHTPIEKVLDNENRKSIFLTVCSYPGMYQTEILEHLSVSRTVLRNHLEKLKKCNLVRLEHEGVKTYMYPTGKAILYLQRNSLTP